MTQIFGSKQSFAIEAEIASFYGENQALGHIRLWIDGQAVGDLEDIAPLGVPWANFENLLNASDCLSDETLIGESKEALVSKVISASYTDSDRYSDSEFDPDQRYRDLILCPDLGEAFDNELVLMLSDEDQVRLVWTDHLSEELQYDQIFERRIELEEFLDPMRRFIAWLQHSMVKH